MPHTPPKQKREKVIAIVGPTAVGKSTLAVLLAHQFNGEMISADSRQVYRELNIGTGKITRKEMRGIPHYLLDVADPKTQFSVAEYQKLAQQKIDEILSRGKLPIICGGTGLYTDSLLNNTAFPQAPQNPKLRKRLEKKSAAELFALLKKLDPRRAETIDQHNSRRLVRAIEISKDTKCTRKGKRGTDAEGDRAYHVLWIGLTAPREELKAKISMRLFARIRKYRMIQEVRQLHQKGLSWKRMEELGLEYRYISRYLRKMLTKEETLAKLQTEIYRYAKRQMTWFRRNKKIHWFHPSQKARIFAMLKDKGL